jgi:hypothetical protein
MNPPAKVNIEAQSPGDSRSLFRLLIDGRIVGKDLTAAQLHLLIGEILRLITLPTRQFSPAPNSTRAIMSEATGR